MTARALLAAALLAMSAPALAGDLVVYVVRHAEKLPTEGDPALSPAGAARADALARLLTDVPLTGVHSTATARTLGTAKPTATAHHLEVRTYDPRDPAALVRHLREAGGAHLVVGHSNTAPALVEALGGGAQPAMPESEYDRLTVVVAPDAGGVVTQILRYGAIGG